MGLQTVNFRLFLRIIRGLKRKKLSKISFFWRTTCARNFYFPTCANFGCTSDWWYLNKPDIKKLIIFFQASVLRAWGGKKENVEAGQVELLKRAQVCYLTSTKIFGKMDFLNIFKNFSNFPHNFLKSLLIFSTNFLLISLRLFWTFAEIFWKFWYIFPKIFENLFLVISLEFYEYFLPVFF